MPQSTTPSSSSLIPSMFINMAGILGSRIFGLLRDIAFAWFWGSTEILQAAYHTAFGIANTLRGLFAEGAFNNAFVPIITQKIKDGKKEEAWKLACQAITCQGTILIVLIILAELASFIILACLPQTPEPTLTYRIVQIFPIIIPYALFICEAGAFSGILNALNQFKVTSLAPITLNVVEIIAILFFVACGMKRYDFSTLVWFAIAVLLSGVLQMMVLLHACKHHGFVFHPDFNFFNPEVKRLVKNILPVLIGAGANQINIVIDKMLGAILGSVAVGALAYSQRLIYLPVGLFGTAMGIVCLPSMAKAKGDDEAMAKCLDTALRQVLFMALPATALLAALAHPAVLVLFQRGAFNDESVRECVYAIAFYLPALPAFCCTRVATTTFYGRNDTTTPVKISLCCIVTNFILNVILMQFFRQGGLALSSSICAWINVSVLLSIEARRLHTWQVRQTLQRAVRLLIASLLSGLTATAIAQFSPLQPLPVLIIGIVTGGFVYLLSCRLLKAPEFTEILNSFRKRRPASTTQA